jgi:hypothetical protein
LLDNRKDAERTLAALEIEFLRPLCLRLSVLGASQQMLWHNPLTYTQRERGRGRGRGRGRERERERGEIKRERAVSLSRERTPTIESSYLHFESPFFPPLLFRLL